jgi:hypothetical protein
MLSTRVFGLAWAVAVFVCLVAARVPAAALTLITCYPFDYVGPAPRRFIVHAERMANVSDSSYATATGEGKTQ